MSILCVAEKPSIANGLSKLLGHPCSSPLYGGKQRLPVHENEGDFKGRRVRFRITSVAGHVCTLDFPPQYQNWTTTEPRTLFGAPVVKKADHKIHKHLHEVSKGCDAVILFLDCDREGENICFEVLDIVQPHLKGFAGGKRVYRARFSALTEEDVARAMRNLVDPNPNESRAVDARQELDLKVGVAFTRFQTGYFQNKYGNLDSRLISYGPCQTPTLGFVVKRHDAIVTFEPRHWWSIGVTVNVANSSIPLSWAQGRLFSRDKVVALLERMKLCKQITCVDVRKKPGRKARPIALNTVELLRVCSKGMGIGPHETMRIAEDLYIRGYISYPRTESTTYPKSFDFVAVLKEHTGHESWGVYVTSLLEIGIVPPRPGRDVGDHPPITVTRVATERALGGHAWRVYDYVARHFFASISPDCEFEKLKATWELQGERFTSSTVEVLKPGYTLVLTHEAVTTTTVASSSPQAKQQYPILQCSLLEGDTQPPPYLSESELITLMEQNGIGTDASIPVHVNNICERNFVRVTSNRELVPTPLGIHLIHGYNKIGTKGRFSSLFFLLPLFSLSFPPSHSVATSLRPRTECADPSRQS